MGRSSLDRGNEGVEAGPEAGAEAAAFFAVGGVRKSGT